MSESAKTTRETPAETPEGDGPTAAEVARYLGEHPDFFVGQAKLLEAMTPPERWTGDGVVDMQKFMLDGLRDEIDTLRRDAREMIETTRSNMSNQARVHTAVLALIEVAGSERLAHVIAHELPLLLDLDAVTVGFEAAAGDGSAALAALSLQVLKPGKVEAVFGRDRQAVLLGEVKDDGELFGAAAGLVQSAALARLRPGKALPPGLLALGSRGAIFAPGQGTELVVFLARVVETCLKRCLEKPA